MKAASRLMICLAVIVLSTGCRRAAKCTVTAYGPEYLTYTGSGEQFGNACRQVLHELGYKEQLSENSFQYPYHGEGSSSHKQNERVIAVKGYMQTKDDAGTEYKITTVILGKHDPLVILESTSPDRYKLVNALCAEFSKQGIEVRQY